MQCSVTWRRVIHPRDGLVDGVVINAAWTMVLFASRVAEWRAARARPSDCVCLIASGAWHVSRCAQNRAVKTWRLWRFRGRFRGRLWRVRGRLEDSTGDAETWRRSGTSGQRRLRPGERHADCLPRRPLAVGMVAPRNGRSWILLVWTLGCLSLRRFNASTLVAWSLGRLVAWLRCGQWRAVAADGGTAHLIRP